MGCAAGRGQDGHRQCYAARFKDAWEAVSYTANICKTGSESTRMFANALRDSTLPAAVKEAASANLSTLATTTCFRTADGEFHAFEGSDDQAGLLLWQLHACVELRDGDGVSVSILCAVAAAQRVRLFHGRCRRHAFPPVAAGGQGRSGFAAADGQMGQIIHAWLDWKISGDDALLEDVARAKKALEFAWVGRMGRESRWRMEGVQHNTYDVEFYGPNPMCGIYYLGALRAGEEMARATGDAASAETYRKLVRAGKPLDRRESFQRRVLCAESARDSARMKLRITCAATWDRRTRRLRNTRWAAAAWRIN
jgi:non-lysosomal glucosylceramidase